jgi:hypothetical protein
MASIPLDNLRNKDSQARLSTNHNAGIVKGLRELKIAFIVMSRYPEVLDEFKKAVMSGDNQPEPEVRKSQIAQIGVGAPR